MAEFKKVGKGYEVYLNAEFLFWVIGSKKSAKKELEIYLNNKS